MRRQAQRRARWEANIDGKPAAKGAQPEDPLLDGPNAKRDDGRALGHFPLGAQFMPLLEMH